MKDKILNVIHALYNPRYIAANMAGGGALAYCFNIAYPLMEDKISCISDPFGNNHAAFLWSFLFGWVYLAQLQMVEKITNSFMIRVIIPQMLIFLVGLYLCGYPIF